MDVPDVLLKSRPKMLLVMHIILNIHLTYKNNLRKQSKAARLLQVICRYNSLPLSPQKLI